MEQTANSMFSYNQHFCGIALENWVQNAHKYNCIKNNWEHTPLKQWSFGYDNLAVSLGYALSKFDDKLLQMSAYTETDVQQLAEYIHDGWCINYIYWRDHQPYLSGNYIAPYSPLGDDRRNACALTPYAELPVDEKEKDVILAKYVLSFYFSS